MSKHASGVVTRRKTPFSVQEPSFSDGCTGHSAIDEAGSLRRAILERLHHEGENVRQGDAEGDFLFPSESAFPSPR